MSHGAAVSGEALIDLKPNPPVLAYPSRRPDAVRVKLLLPLLTMPVRHVPVNDVFNQRKRLVPQNMAEALGWERHGFDAKVFQGRRVREVVQDRSE